jgi:hypothetical protein
MAVFDFGKRSSQAPIRVNRSGSENLIADSSKVVNDGFLSFRTERSGASDVFRQVDFQWQEGLARQFRCFAFDGSHHEHEQFLAKRGQRRRYRH